MGPNWFNPKISSPFFNTIVEFLYFAFIRGHDNRDVLELVLLLHPDQDLKSIHLRHVVCQKNSVELEILFGEDFLGFEAIGSDLDYQIRKRVDGWLPW